MANEALFLNWAVYTNLASWDEVIAWADGWIDRLDEWPEQLTEISLNSRQKDSGARAALAQLASASQTREFPRQLIEWALTNLQKGRDPFQVISELYPLVYEKMETGCLELPLNTPEPLRTAIYQLDYDAESVSPNIGWANIESKDVETWLRGRIQEELQRALKAIAETS